MYSIYDDFAKDCIDLAAKTKCAEDKLRLLLLAAQWRTVAADQRIRLATDLAVDAPAIFRQH
jgi:hypothetical protein